MQKKSDIEKIIFSDSYIKSHFEHLFVELMDKTIAYARHLNNEGKKSVSHPLVGTDFLHGMLKKKLISNAIYQQLVRLAEDASLTYEIIIK